MFGETWGALWQVFRCPPSPPLYFSVNGSWYIRMIETLLHRCLILGTPVYMRHLQEGIKRLEELRVTEKEELPAKVCLPSGPHPSVRRTLRIHIGIAIPRIRRILCRAFDSRFMTNFLCVVCPGVSSYHCAEAVVWYGLLPFTGCERRTMPLCFYRSCS